MCLVVPGDLCPVHFPGQWSSDLSLSGNKLVYGKMIEDFWILIPLVCSLDDALYSIVTTQLCK